MDRFAYLVDFEREAAMSILASSCDIDKAANSLRSDGVEEVNAIRILRAVYDINLADAHRAFVGLV